MKDLRMLGSMISKLSAENNVTSEEMTAIFQCTAEQVESIKDGRLFPAYLSVQAFAKRVHSTVSALMKGDEEHYNKTVVHCMGEFTNPDNREEVLDIIDDYLTLLSVTE